MRDGHFVAKINTAGSSHVKLSFHCLGITHEICFTIYTYSLLKRFMSKYAARQFQGERHRQKRFHFIISHIVGCRFSIGSKLWPEA